MKKTSHIYIYMTCDSIAVYCCIDAYTQNFIDHFVGVNLVV